MGDLPRSTKPNFYSVLGIPKGASLYDISKAYKSLVMKWHPDKHTTNKAEAEAQFKTITEAYRVLSSKNRDESAIPTFVDEPKTPKTPKAPKTPKTPKAPKEARKVTFQVQDKDDDGFDSSPTFISRSISRNTPLITSNPSTPKGDPPLSRVGTRRSSNTPIIYSQTSTRKKPQPIEKKLECTLEELWRGCVKKIKITRDVISETGLIVQEEEILKIRVKPGWKKGTKITFEGKGDERPGSLPADIIFIIDEKRHSIFKREGEDLELGVEVPLVQALTGCTISVPLLGGEQMTMSFDDILYPGYEKIISGQGMPKSKEEGMRGDLRLKFLVRFPAELSDEQRSNILNVLKDCS